MAGTDHHQDVFMALLFDLFAQARSHVAVTFVDQGQKQILAVFGKLGKGGL